MPSCIDVLIPLVQSLIFTWSSL